MLHFTKRLVLTSLITIGTLISLTRGQSCEYALFELPVLSEQEPHTWTRAINNNSEIVGASVLRSGNFHAVV